MRSTDECVNQGGGGTDGMTQDANNYRHGNQKIYHETSTRPLVSTATEALLPDKNILLVIKKKLPDDPSGNVS